MHPELNVMVTNCSLELHTGNPDCTPLTPLTALTPKSRRAEEEAEAVAEGATKKGGGGGGDGGGDGGVNTTVVNITVSTWTYRRMQGYNPHHGGLNPGQVRESGTVKDDVELP
jgi:hypothetical protein